MRTKTESEGSPYAILFIEAPQGIRPEKKTVIMRKSTEAVEEAYRIGDTLISLREYSAENVAMDGRLQAENPKILEALKKINAGVLLRFLSVRNEVNSGGRDFLSVSIRVSRADQQASGHASREKRGHRV